MRNWLERESYGLLVIAVVVLLMASCASPSHSVRALDASTAYSCDFEDSFCDFQEQSKVGDAPPSSVRRSSFVTPARSGRRSVRLHTEPGDNQVHGSGTWERNDLQKPTDPGYCHEGQDEWWAVSVLFPDDFVYPPGPDGGVVFEFHHDSSGGLPNFSVDTMPGSGMRIRGYGGPTINGGQYGTPLTDPYGAVGTVTRNRWYDFVIHALWSSASSGRMEVWLNEVKVVDYLGSTLYTGIPCYLKLTNYHGPYTRPSSILFDRVARGPTRASVSIAQTPAPIPAPPPARTITCTGNVPVTGEFQLTCK